MSKATKSTKATKTPTKYVYAYVFNGGVLKQNHCVVSVSEDHPETTVFNELKRYYGNDVKGAYYKCSKSLEDVQAGITFKLSKFALGEILYNNNFTETKKILLDVTGLKQCSGTINVYNKGEDGDEAEQKAEPEEKKSTKKASKSKKEETVESDDEAEAEDSEPEKKKPAKKASSKSKKGKVEAESDAEDSEPEEKKPAKKASSKSKKVEAEDSEPEEKKSAKKASSKSKATDTKKASKKVVNDDSESDDDIKPKTNNTSIELSDESDEEDTN